MYKPAEKMGPTCPSAFRSEPDEHTLVHRGKDLTPTHWQELTQQVHQFADIFSFTPSLTHLVQHEIKMPLGWW